MHKRDAGGRISVGIYRILRDRDGRQYSPRRSTSKEIVVGHVNASIEGHSRVCQGPTSIR